MKNNEKEEMIKKYGLMSKEEFEKMPFVESSYVKGNNYRVLNSETKLNTLNPYLHASTDTEITMKIIWVE